VRRRFASHPALIEALELFLHALFRADTSLRANSGAASLPVRQANDRAFGQCAEWSDLQAQASELLFVARQYGHRAVWKFAMRLKSLCKYRKGGKTLRGCSLRG
jgi:hypothetical protein